MIPVAKKKYYTIHISGKLMNTKTTQPRLPKRVQTIWMTKLQELVINCNLIHNIQIRVSQSGGYHVSSCIMYSASYHHIAQQFVNQCYILLVSTLALISILFIKLCMYS